MKSGADESPKSHLQPKFGATAKAKATSKQAPSAQKHCGIRRIVKFNSIEMKFKIILTSNKTTHFARCLVGKNSAYNVTLWMLKDKEK